MTTPVELMLEPDAENLGLYSPRPGSKRSEVAIRIPSIPHLLIPSPLTPQSDYRGRGASLCVNPQMKSTPPPPPLPPTPPSPPCPLEAPEWHPKARVGSRGVRGCKRLQSGIPRRAWGPASPLTGSKVASRSLQSLRHRGPSEQHQPGARTSHGAFAKVGCGVARAEPALERHGPRCRGQMREPAGHARDSSSTEFEGLLGAAAAEQPSSAAGAGPCYLAAGCKQLAATAAAGKQLAADCGCNDS